ncbi:hypothetical protein CH063_01083 [Colletotrichum higginsianum]|uniref:Tat pathway signal sequence n=3 Tax=Colletotrichum destructivum species complex TaxID=2707350 RepID=H1V1M6_COLHI|nr:Tat pathway signal sequence [Colletotrichum higginsianum IMI 349063]OBR04060.1 Tat pathway signal sequence [Colletotrichum higginsianum IMI 349063]CCF34128.1 hypothetical protein CH063_01083 [Colletotrichum higginsianum]
MEAKSPSYKPLMSTDSRDSESVEDFGDHQRGGRGFLQRFRWLQWNQQTTSRIPSFFGSSLAVLSILILSMVFGFIFSVLRAPSDQDCARQLSMWSPALDAVEYVSMDFNDAFNSTSIYRGLPTPEREQAWFDLTYKHAVEIPPERLSGLNRSEEDHLKHVPEEVGDGYVALLEVFHQLHCLNMVRVYTWWQVGKYDKPPVGLSNDPLKNRIHVDHCLEALRISLMCFADVTPLMVRLGGPAGARADFNTHHKCRDFNKISDWIDDNWTVR